MRERSNPYYEDLFERGCNMSITDMIISAVLKKGVLYEARNVDADVEVPVVIDNLEHRIKVNIKCEHMTLRVNKEDEKES